MGGACRVGVAAQGSVVVLVRGPLGVGLLPGDPVSSGALVGASQVMVTSPGLGLVGVTPLTVLSSARTVAPASNRNGAASSSAVTRSSHTGRNPAGRGFLH